MNASGRRLDVWLVYRCVHCAFTWNLTVVERATPEAIGPAALAAYHRNDAARAWARAFDAALLRRAGARHEAGVPVRVERGPLPEGRAVVRLALVHPLRLRLHRLLAQELGLPRPRLAAVVAAPEALRRPVHDGQVVVMAAPRTTGLAPPCSAGLPPSSRSRIRISPQAASASASASRRVESPGSGVGAGRSIGARIGG